MGKLCVDLGKVCGRPSQPGRLGARGADGHASLTGEGVMRRGKSPPLGSMPRRPDRGGWRPDGNYCGWADNLATCECYCRHKLVPTGVREGDVEIGQVISAAARLPLRVKMRAGDRYRGKECGSRMQRVDADETTPGHPGTSNSTYPPSQSKLIVVVGPIVDTNKHLPLVAMVPGGSCRSVSAGLGRHSPAMSYQTSVVGKERMSDLVVVHLPCHAAGGGGLVSTTRPSWVVFLAVGDV